jgi:hypothetical protein
MNPIDHLIGNAVINATEDTLTLSDGTRLRFDREASDCCTWMELRSLSTTDNVITAAEFRDNEDETDGEGAYRAWLHVVTEAGELSIAEAEGDAGNGCYLHGFALGVTVLPAEAEVAVPWHPTRRIH